MAGWIKLHRSILNHWITTKPEYFSGWIKILLEVNHSDGKVLIDSELIDCKRGQSLNSIGTWVKVLGRGWSPQKIRTFMVLLQKDSMIEVEGLRKTTRLTVCNYDKYQFDQHTDNEEITHRQQTDNKQITTNKNDKKVKNVNNEKNNTYCPVIEYLNTKTGSSFKSSTQSTQRHINARMAEGFTIEDFKKVIDVKCEDWLHDEKMSIYLRPETLFGTKFESYLNSKKSQPKDEIQYVNN